MNPIELLAARTALFLTVKEAAEHIGDCSPRAWQLWESGKNPIPRNLPHEINDLLQLRSQLIEQRTLEATASESGHIVLTWYADIDAFQRDTGKLSVPMWRVTQSVAAHMYAEGLAALEVIQ